MFSGRPSRTRALQDISRGTGNIKIARIDCVFKSRGAVVCPSRIGAIADWVLGIIAGPPPQRQHLLLEPKVLVGTVLRCLLTIHVVGAGITVRQRCLLLLYVHHSLADVEDLIGMSIGLVVAVRVGLPLESCPTRSWKGPKPYLRVVPPDRTRAAGCVFSTPTRYSGDQLVCGNAPIFQV
jgi:hypothetical protein